MEKNSIKIFLNRVLYPNGFIIDGAILIIQTSDYLI